MTRDAAGEPPDAAAPEQPTAGAGAPPSAADAAAQPTRENLTTELRRDNTGSSGYCNSVSVRNDGEEAVSWSVELVVLGTLSNHWSCNVSGSRRFVEFSGVEWNRTLLAGQTTEFGFCVSR